MLFYLPYNAIITEQNLKLLFNFYDIFHLDIFTHTKPSVIRNKNYKHMKLLIYIERGKLF